jgi:hypothetical protein
VIRTAQISVNSYTHTTQKSPAPARIRGSRRLNRPARQHARGPPPPRDSSSRSIAPAWSPSPDGSPSSHFARAAGDRCPTLRSEGLDVDGDACVSDESASHPRGQWRLSGPAVQDRSFARAHRTGVVPAACRDRQTAAGTRTPAGPGRARTTGGPAREVRSTAAHRVTCGPVSGRRPAAPRRQAPCPTDAATRAGPTPARSRPGRRARRPARSTAAVPRARGRRARPRRPA